MCVSIIYIVRVFTINLTIELNRFSNNSLCGDLSAYVLESTEHPLMLKRIIPLLTKLRQICKCERGSFGRARESRSESREFAPRGRPLPTGWVGVSIMRPAETEVMVFPLCLCVAARYIVRRQF